MDATVANRFLASLFGPDRSSVAPDTWQVALYVGDPEVDGVEQDGPGYERATLDSDSFPAFASLTDGSTSATVDFADATGEWPNQSTHFVLFNGTEMGPSQELSIPVDVADAGALEPVQVTIWFSDVTEEL